MVRSIMREGGWEIVLKYAATKTEQWNGMKSSGRTAFETLRDVHRREGKTEGLKEFLDELENQATQ